GQDGIPDPAHQAPGRGADDAGLHHARGAAPACCRGQTAPALATGRGIAADFMPQLLVFCRYRESYPRRSESQQNCYSRAGDERSAVPVCVGTMQTAEAAIPRRGIPYRKRRARKTTSRTRLSAPQKDKAATRKTRTLLPETQGRRRRVCCCLL